MRSFRTSQFFGNLAPLLALTALAALFSTPSAYAQGYNPAGSNVTVNSGSYDRGYPFDGYDNYGTITVEPGSPGYPQFDGDFLGLYNGSGTASVQGGAFDKNYIGFDTEHGTISVSGGEFGQNTYGVFNNLGSTAVVSGGTLDSNGIGLLNWSSTAYVTGGTYTGNSTNVQDISGALYLSGGTFGDNGTTYDLLEDGGTTNVYGTAFSAPLGDLAQGAGSFTWTQASGRVQTLSYDNISGGTIDLIVGAAPSPVPEASTTATLGLLLCLGAAGLAVQRRRFSSCQ